MNSLDAMDRDNLYREVGESLHLAQTLEFNISAFISIMNRHHQTHIEGAPLIVGNDRRTLGQLIREIQKHAKLDQAGIDALSEALEARNYVAHRFFIRNIAAFTDSRLCNEAITALKIRAKRIAAGAVITSGFVQGFCQALNIKGVLPRFPGHLLAHYGLNGCVRGIGVEPGRCRKAVRLNEPESGRQSR